MSLAETHIKFAYAVADKVGRRFKWVDRQELRSEALVGLVEAERRFDADRGVTFATYAYSWILNQIYRHIAINSPVGNVAVFWALRRVRQGRSKADEERALQNLDADHVARLSGSLNGGDRSLDEAIDSNRTLLDTLTDPRDTDDVVRLDEEDFVHAVVTKLGKLRPVEEDVLREMILADAPATLQTIGDRYGLTREAIRLIRLKLIGKIKTHVQGLDPT